MAHYLIEVGYTPQAWNAQIDKPANALERITPALEACGGTVHSMFYAFGEIDLVAIGEFPTPEAAAAFGLAVGSSGALRLYRTTPLLTLAEGMESMRRANEVRKVYAPPLTISLVEQPAGAR
jgi:uncharacterized protein with GYD domain